MKRMDYPAVLQDLLGVDGHVEQNNLVRSSGDRDVPDSLHPSQTSSAQPQSLSTAYSHCHVPKAIGQKRDMPPEWP